MNDLIKSLSFIVSFAKKTGAKEVASLYKLQSIFFLFSSLKLCKYAHGFNLIFSLYISSLNPSIIFA